MTKASPHYSSIKAWKSDVAQLYTSPEAKVSAYLDAFPGDRQKLYKALSHETQSLKEN